MENFCELKIHEQTTQQVKKTKKVSILCIAYDSPSISH